MIKNPVQRDWRVSVCLLLVFALSVAAQSRITYLPLFVIERSLNANVVHYDARLRGDGKLDPAEPVIAYWIMSAEDGRRQPLNILERTRAYGFTSRVDGAEDAYRISLAADRGRGIRIYRKDGAVHAETMIAGHRAYLQKIYINVRKSLIVDTADSAELFGVDVDTAQACSEKIHGH